MKSKTLGYHLVADFFDCDRSKIDDIAFVRFAMLEAARIANATIITDIFHSFHPQGLSGVVVIAESHIAIHSWPEHNCVAIDIFSCSEKMRPEYAIEYLKSAFAAQRTLIKKTDRGVLLEPPLHQEIPA